MIISRTPFRVSFFGGGTDYHTWYEGHGGAVLSTCINHYCYLNVRYLPPFFVEKSRVVWSHIERVMQHEEIVHPAVRGILQHMNIEQGIEIHHTGDLPARSGLGSSSAFTVGLLNALHALAGSMTGKHQLASEAVHVEREVLKENVGVQDQIAAAYGGFNKVTLVQGGNDFIVEPVIAPVARIEELQSHMLLFFTGVSRTASNVAKAQMQAADSKQKELMAMQQLVDEALSVITSSQNIAEFGKLLDESWKLKRSLAANISPGFIDELYEKARSAGAIGGKLLGAGGGGFMLLFAKPEDHPRIKQALEHLLWVPFEFEASGSSIILYDPREYTQSTLARRDFYHLRQKA